MDFNTIVIAALLVIVPLALIHVLSRRYREDANVLLRRDAARKTTAAPLDQEALAGEVKVLLASGRKIEAIKLVLSRRGFSLRAAKELVETIERGASPAGEEQHMAEAAQSARDLAPEVQRLVKQGQRLEAVKLIRERTGMGLKEAKELVDRLA